MVSTISNNCLFVSDMLIDKDLGLIRLIKEIFMKSCVDYFYEEIIDNIISDPMVGKYILYNRDTINPLNVISKEDVSDELLDILYNNFINKAYDSIVDRAEPTDAMQLILSTGYTSGTVNSAVVCGSKHEEEALKNYFNQHGCSIRTIVSTLEDINIDSYDTIILRKYEDVYKFKNLHGKNIIVSDAEYNYETLEEYNFHELNPIISIYITNNDNELSKMNMYRSYEIDDTNIDKTEGE